MGLMGTPVFLNWGHPFFQCFFKWGLFKWVNGVNWGSIGDTRFFTPPPSQVGTPVFIATRLGIPSNGVDFCSLVSGTML